MDAAIACLPQGNNSKLVTQYDPEELLFITDEQVNVAMEHATQTYERLVSSFVYISK